MKVTSSPFFAEREDLSFIIMSSIVSSTSPVDSPIINILSFKLIFPDSKITCTALGFLK